MVLFTIVSLSPRSTHPNRRIAGGGICRFGSRAFPEGDLRGLPELLRRLIYATLGPSAVVHFPSDESVQYPGWDGICAVSTGSGFVPTGESVWEIGCQRTRIREKADKDFKKRSSNPLGRDARQTAFVFVTPQRFTGKENWVTEKKALDIWRDVVAIDGDDLVHWLEIYPAVAQWLSVKIGRRPQGLRNMEEVWAEWVRATKTPLTPDVILTGRDEEQAAVLKWLQGKPQVLSIFAEAPDEATAFLYAAISSLPESYRLSYWSHCVVAESSESARQLLAGLGTPLIIVLTDPEAGITQRLVEDGHHIFAAYGPGANDFPGALRLPRPWKFDLQMALIRTGLSEEDSHRFAHASGRSITVLRRLMPAAPSYRPRWAEQASPELITAMIAGAWVETSASDRKIISALAGCPYQQVETVLAPLAAALDSPLVRSGSIWKVASLRDLWFQIGDQVTPSQLARFESVFHSALSTTNPRYRQRPKRIFYEEENEFGEESSVALRHGLTETMIAMSVHPERAKLITDPVGYVNRAIHNLLERAPPALWWSLSRDFCNLAEAAPDEFLEALEVALEADDPKIMPLFCSNEGLMHPVEHLSNLLWALEMLARSPNYLVRSALLLAHLDEIDPGGTWANRPFASLRRIFVIWSPQTHAKPDQRLKVIDRIIHKCPAVGWKLLLTLVPRFYDISEPSHKPNWRDFTPDEPEEITPYSMAAAANAIGSRLLDQVGDDVNRWMGLLEHWSAFDDNWRAAAVKQLETFTYSLNEPSEIEALRDKLRGLLQNHRNFKDAHWAMTEQNLNPLDNIFNLLQPKSVEDRVAWLFRPGATQLRPNVDWNEQQAELADRQMNAAEDLLAELSPDQMLAFASKITLHHALGAAIVKTSVQDEVKYSLLKWGLLADDHAQSDVGLGILYELKLQAGDNSDDWVRNLWHQAIVEGWGERAEMHIVHYLPPNASTWAGVAARSVGLMDAYWRTLSAHSIPGSSDPTYVVDHLLAVGRGRDAVGWLGHNLKVNPNGALLMRALYAAAKSDLQGNGNDATMFSYFVGIILDYLETAPDVSEQEIVRLEWIYFQFLRYTQRPAHILHRALARDPEFFVDLMKMIFFPAEDSGVVEPKPENVENARNLARQAYDVLHDWTQVPGTDDQGVIDPTALEDWVKRARKLLAETGRSEVGDSKIGEILSAAKRAPDQPWPPEPVREVIEVTRSRNLERGFEIGVYNHRGVTVRTLRDGGEQERALAECYRRDAEALRFDWPRTAACLDRIATTYQVDANREDISAEQRDWL